jgi:hypothetical protein
MATAGDRIRIVIDGDPSRFEAALYRGQAEFGAFTVNIQKNIDRVNQHFDRMNQRSGDAARQSVRGWSAAGKALGTTGQDLRNRFQDSFNAIANSSVATANRVKQQFFSMHASTGLLPKQIEAEWRKSFADIEKIIEKASIQVKKFQGISPGQHAALSTLAHSLPFGLGRTASFAMMNFSDMARDAGSATGVVSRLSAAISAIPIAPILAAAVAIQLMSKMWDMAKAAFTRFIQPAIKLGLNYNDIIENSRLGMAGLMFQMTELVKNNQVITDSTEKWNSALEISDRLVVQLQNAALKTRAVYSELARGMQEGFAPMLQAGIVESQVSPFVTRFIHLMSTLRIPLREIGQEMRAFFNLETNPRTARLSFVMINQAMKDWNTGLTETKERLQELKAEGTLFDWFMGKTTGAEISGLESMKTLGGYLSNLKEAFEAAMGEGTKGLYSALIDLSEQLLDSLIQVGESGKRTFNPELVTLIKAVASALESTAKALGNIVEKLLQVGGPISTMKEWFRLMKEDTIAKTIKVSFEIVGDVGQVIWDKFLKPAGESVNKYNPVVWAANRAINQTKEWATTPRGLYQYTNEFEPLDTKISQERGKQGFKLHPNAISTYEQLLPPLEAYDKAIEAVAKKGQETFRALRDAQIENLAVEKKIPQWEATYLLALNKLTDKQKDFQAAWAIEGDAISKRGSLKERFQHWSVLSEFNEEIELRKQIIKLQMDQAAAEERQKESKERISTDRAYEDYITNSTRKHRDAITELANLKAPSWQVKYTTDIQKLEDAFADAELANKRLVQDNPALTSRQVKGLNDALKVLKDELDARRKIVEFQKLQNWMEAQRKSGKDIKWKTEYELTPGSDTWVSEGYLKDYLAQVQKYERGIEQFYGKMWQDLERSHIQSAQMAGDVFNTVAREGAKGFGKVAAQNFNRLIQEGADKLGSTLLNFRADRLSELDFNMLSPENKEKYNEIQRGRQNKIDAVTGMMSIGLGSYSAGRANQSGAIAGGVMGGALSGAGLGLQWGAKSGNLVGAATGAIIGAIIGGIAAAMGKAAARDEYKYAKIAIDAYGQASLFATKNLQPAEAKEMQARVQEQFDKFWNGYMNLAVKYGGDFIPKILDQARTIIIQKEASKNFLKHFDELVNGIIPDNIMEVFRPTLKSIAGSLGMAADQFDKMFRKFDNLSPEKTLELFGIVFDALQKINKATAIYNNDSVLGGGAEFNMMVARAGLDARQSYARQFAEEREEIRKLAEMVTNLTGEGQVRALGEFGDSLEAMMQKHKQLAQEISNFLQNSLRTFAETRRNLQREGMGVFETDEQGNKVWKPDYQKQADFTKSYLDMAVRGIEGAQNLQEMEYWQGEFFKTFNELSTIYKQAGPEAYEAFRIWSIGADGQSGILATVQNAIQAKVGQWGAELANETNKLMADLKPAIDLFKQGVVDTNTGVREFNGEIRRAIDPVRKFAAAVDDAAARLSNLGTGGGGVAQSSSVQADGQSFSSRVTDRRASRILSRVS